jgi:MraZ protein
MFIGKYYYTLEEKGRVSLPTKFRQKNKSWVITRGLDGGLFLFKEDDFQNEVEKLLSRTFTKKANRDFIRLMTNEAQVVTPDKNGRVHLPEYLIEFGKLKKALVLIGSGTRIEIWDQKTYHSYMDSIESEAESIAEDLIPQKENKND